MIEPNPFTKIVFKDEYIKRKIYPKMQEAYKAVSWIEYQLVKRGYRAVDVIHLLPETFDKTIEKITLDKLIFLPIYRVKRYNGFAHRHTLVNKLDSSSMVYGVIARNIEDAIKFRDAHYNNDVETIGRLLGYPECDIQFFNIHWGNPSYDLIFETALNTESSTQEEYTIKVYGNPKLNNLIRYFGFHLISWFPCSYTCRNALSVTDTWIKLYKEYSDELYDFTYELLKEKMTWSLLNSIIEVRTPYFIGIVNGYYYPHKLEVIWNV